MEAGACNIQYEMITMINLTGVENSLQDGDIIWLDLASNYLFKVNSGNNRMCEICSKLTIKTPDHCQVRADSTYSSAAVNGDFEQVNTYRGGSWKLTMAESFAVKNSGANEK